MSSGAFGGAASGAATGTMFGPWGTLIGAGLGAAGGLMGDSAQKRANRGAKMRYQGALNNVTNGASVARQDAAEQFGNAQAGLLNRNAERGLTGTSAWDSALNNVMTGRSRAMSGITQDEAAAKNNIMGQYQESVGPNNWATGLSGVFSKLGVLDQLGGVQGQQGVTNAKLGGTEATARLNGGGSMWDELLKMFGGG